jgi:hypothetical protein
MHSLYLMSAPSGRHELEGLKWFSAQAARRSTGVPRVFLFVFLDWIPVSAHGMTVIESIDSHHETRGEAQESSDNG